MRTCTWCGLEQTLSEYHVDKTNPDGLRVVCKQCCRARARQHYQDNRQSHLDYQKAYFRANRETALAYGKAHYQANKEKYDASAKAWRATHAAEVAAKAREWVAANPEKRKNIAKACSHKRRAQKRGTKLIAHVTHERWEQRKAVFGNRCVYCLAPESKDRKLTADHVIPLCRGGPHILANLRPACLSCNSRKQAKKPAEWRAKQHELFP